MGMNKIIILLLVLCCKISPAQYTGGYGVGVSMNSSSGISLSAANTSYSGGISDGVQSYFATALGLYPTSGANAGGSGDGNQMSAASSIVFSTGQTKYSGGVGDGFQTNSALSLQLNPVAAMYAGGTGVGFKIISTSSVSFIASTSGFFGGNSDGFNTNTASSLVFSAPGTGYAGGSGTGFNSNVSSSQNFSTAYTMFSGGSHDGFSSMNYSPTYIFVGSGNWDVATNWYYNSIPPVTLPALSEIKINPSGTNDCILNVSQTIATGGKLTVMPGKRLILTDMVLQ
jgi:hypothetical protein